MPKKDIKFNSNNNTSNNLIQYNINDYITIKPFVNKINSDHNINYTNSEGTKDFKTQLQEKFQKKTKQCPKYELISKTGPDHDQTFNVAVHLGDKIYGPVSAKSKKEAEQLAAKLALDNFNF